LLTGPNRAIGKHLRDRTFGAAVAPKFMRKRNSALIGNRGRRPDDEARPEIGEIRVRKPPVRETCFVVHAVLDSHGVVVLRIVWTTIRFKRTPLPLSSRRALPAKPMRAAKTVAGSSYRRDVLGGLIHEDHRGVT